MPTSTPSRPTTHVERKRERRRREIILAALEAARERGYHVITLEEIAGRLGMRQTALYHYFPDKEAILLACHRESLEELERIVESAAGLTSPAARLGYLLREHVRIMTQTLEGSPLAFEVTALSEPGRSEVLEGRDRFEGVLRSTVSAAIRAGEFREVDPKVAVFALLGAVNWIARWYRPGGSLRPDTLGDAFADLLLGGLLRRVPEAGGGAVATRTLPSPEAP